MMHVVCFILLIGVIVVSGQVAAVQRECNPIDELQCDDGYCIHKLQWCDASVDCLDESDETYCNGEIPCRSIHFPCRNGKCVPFSAVCDKYDDCHDGSDEGHCDGVRWLGNSTQVSTKLPLVESDLEYFIKTDVLHLDNTTKDALAKAVQYLSMRDSDFGWGIFTPRATVALAFVSKESPVVGKQKQLMEKQLNIQLLLDLMGKETVSLSGLALYINALYATCQDPRNFQGVDLVARLRSETDTAMKSNLSIPLAFLTLCISNKTRYEDNFELAYMYNAKEFSRTGSRALIMMAMICIMRKDDTEIFHEYKSNFFSSEYVKAKTADVYAQALFMQASIAAGYKVTLEELISKQLPDGSFGDMLATYYAIPVLLNSSLLELKCNGRNKGRLLESRVTGSKGENEVAYSLRITSGEDLNSHSITITFDGKKSFFDIMMMAAARDPLFRFLYDESSDGKMVYSLAGIPNDIESGRSWVLYSGDIDKVVANSMENLSPETEGVDRIFPKDKSHFVFWLKRNSQID